MNIVALVITTYLSGSTFTIMDSMEECVAVQKEMQVEAVLNEAAGVTLQHGLLNIVTKDYGIVMAVCAEQDQTPKVLFDKQQARKEK